MQLAAEELSVVKKTVETGSGSTGKMRSTCPVWIALFGMPPNGTSRRAHGPRIQHPSK